MPRRAHRIPSGQRRTRGTSRGSLQPGRALAPDTRRRPASPPRHLHPGRHLPDRSYRQLQPHPRRRSNPRSVRNHRRHPILPSGASPRSSVLLLHPRRINPCPAVATKAVAPATRRRRPTSQHLLQSASPSRRPRRPLSRSSRRGRTIPSRAHPSPPLPPARRLTLLRQRRRPARRPAHPPARSRPTHRP